MANIVKCVDEFKQMFSHILIGYDYESSLLQHLLVWNRHLDPPATKYIFVYGKKTTNDTNYIKLHIVMLILRWKNISSLREKKFLLPKKFITRVLLEEFVCIPTFQLLVLLFCLFVCVCFCLCACNLLFFCCCCFLGEGGTLYIIYGSCKHV